MPKSQKQASIDKYFPQRAIAYQPGLALIFDSPCTGIFVSQLLYWQDKGKNREGWIYKSIPELQKETGLSRYNQETAIKKCVELGFLETKLTGRVPRTRHFRLNIETLKELIPSMMDSHGLNYLKPPTRSVVKPHTTTESTPKTTTKTIEEVRKALADSMSMGNFKRGSH